MRVISARNAVSLAVIFAVAVTIVLAACGGDDESQSGEDCNAETAFNILRPSIVRISTDGEPAGTGFVVGDREIVTNAHVVAGASTVSIKFSTGHEQTVGASAIQGNAEFDIAVVEADTDGTPSVTSGDPDDLVQGRQVLVVGYPLDLSRDPSATQGVFSGIANLRAGEYLQTDAAVNPGNSGGPIADLCGNVLGVVTAKLSNAENVGLAIPIDTANSVVELVRDGKGSALSGGATTIDISGVSELVDGTLTVGSDIAYAPMEFYIEGTETPDGLDIDLAKAIAQELGVEVEFINSGFDGLIGSLGTDDFDVIMSAMTITDERSEEINFVPYLNVGTGILVPAGNPNNIQSLEDLCGLTVAVQVGTIQVDQLEAANEDCSEAIDIVTFDTNPLAVEDLRTGGADANLADFPVAFVDAEASDGELEVLDLQIEPEPYGIGVRKDSSGLKDVLEQALAAVKASGVYAQILESWSLGEAALD